MANKNTNPGGGKDDNEMRIQFGLILALCQNCAISHNPLFHAQNSNLFKGLSPENPWHRKTHEVGAALCMRRKHGIIAGVMFQGE